MQKYFTPCRQNAHQKWRFAPYSASYDDCNRTGGNFKKLPAHEFCFIEEKLLTLQAERCVAAPLNPAKSHFNSETFRPARFSPRRKAQQRIRPCPRMAASPADMRGSPPGTAGTRHIYSEQSSFTHRRCSISISSTI